MGGKRPGEGAHQRRKHGVEHHVREVARHLLLVTPPLGERRFQEGCWRPVLRGEGRAAQQQVERAQGVVVAGRSRSARSAS